MVVVNSGRATGEGRSCQTGTVCAPACLGESPSETVRRDLVVYTPFTFKLSKNLELGMDEQLHT